MRLIKKKEPKKNGKKKYVLQIQKEASRTSTRSKQRTAADYENNKGWKRSASPRGPKKITQILTM